MEALLARKQRVYFTVARLLLVQRSAAETAFAAACEHVRTLGDASDDTVNRAVVACCQQQPSPLTAALGEQLAARVLPVAQLADLRPTLLLDEWKKLPALEQALLLRVYDRCDPLPSIAAAQQQTPSHLLRELSLIHADLLHRLQNALPDEPFLWPTNGHEIARLALQWWLNHEPADAILVLESLLLSDPQAQAFYLRFAALLCELDLRFHEMPALPPRRTLPTRPVQSREHVLTIAFVVASVLTVGYVLWVLVAQLRK